VRQVDKGVQLYSINQWILDRSWHAIRTLLLLSRGRFKVYYIHDASTQRRGNGPNTDIMWNKKRVEKMFLFFYRFVILYSFSTWLEFLFQIYKSEIFIWIRIYTYPYYLKTVYILESDSVSSLDVSSSNTYEHGPNMFWNRTPPHAGQELF
jgi:hypothetical protein